MTNSASDPAIEAQADSENVAQVLYVTPLQIEDAAIVRTVDGVGRTVLLERIHPHTQERSAHCMRDLFLTRNLEI